MKEKEIHQELQEMEPEVKEKAPELKKENQRNYYDELVEKCWRDTGHGDHIDSFYAYVCGNCCTEEYEKAEDAFFSHCDPILDISKGSLNEKGKFEKLLGNYREEITKMGFNAGYEIGFSKGVMTVLKLMDLDSPKAEDLIKIVLGEIE